MEFSINKSLFSEALSLVNSVVPERAPRAVMQNLLLAGNADNTITLSATDLEIGLKINLEVKDLRDPEKVLLPAGKLNALVKASNAEDVDVAVNDCKAVLKTRQGRFQIVGSDVADYPSIPEFKPEGAVFIHGDDFAEAVQKTMFSTAKGDTRYALNGIYVNIGEHGAEFVASDTHRLSLVKKRIRNPEKSVFDGIVLTKGMVTVAKLAAGSDVVEITMTHNELLARTVNGTVVVRKVEGVFPRYGDVIPSDNPSKVTLNRDELLRSLQSIGLMTSDETKSVQFSVRDNAVFLSAASEGGDGNINLDAETAGEKIDVKFNYLLLAEALKNIGDDKVTIQYQDGERPARIDSGDFTYVIMPINR